MFTPKPLAVILLASIGVIVSLGTLLTPCAQMSVRPPLRGLLTRPLSSGAAPNEPQRLAPGNSIDRDLGGGGHHSYQLELPSRQFIQIIVEQQGIDVVLTISRLNGAQLTKVDRPNSTRGRETVSIVTPAAGAYLLEISSLESTSAQGRYHLHVNELREPNPDDATWICAEQTVFEGERLRSQATADSFRKAIELFNKAEQLWRLLQQPYEQAVALYGSGISCTSLSDNQQAIEYFNRALALFDHDAHGQAITKGAMGWPYMYLGDHDKALDTFSQAFQLYHAEENVRGEGITLYGIGWVHALRGEDQEALANFSESLKRRRQAKDRRGEAITLAGIGKIEARRGNHTQALDALKQARDVLASRDRYAEADILSNLGWVYSALEDDRSALESFQRALPLREQVGDRTGQATTFFGISTVQRRLGNLQEALPTIESAVSIIEALRARGSSQQLRISYFSSIQDYYDFYIGLLMQLHKHYPSAGYAAKALYVSERARARGLIDLLAEAQIDLRQGIDPALLEQERIIDEKLNAAGTRRYQILSGAHRQEELQRATYEVSELANQFDLIGARIRTASPRYAAITQQKPLTAADIQQRLLDEDTLLLEYALGDEGSYLWAVTQNEITSYELPSRSEVDRIARSTYEQLTARDLIVPGETTDTKRARVAQADRDASKGLDRLGTILLGPVAERLNKKRVIIVAQGALQFVPFAALPWTMGTPTSQSENVKRIEVSQSGSDRRPPLIVDHEVVVLPSASTLAVLRQATKSRQAPVKTVAVLADPVYSPTDARLRMTVRANVKTPAHILPPQPETDINDASSNEGGSSTFPRLVSSLWEAKKIIALVPAEDGKLFLNFAASRTTGMSGQLRQYRLLHFAAHALIDDERPELSGIVLSMVDEKGRPQDGFLRSNAIFNLKLSADLVVLSACRTGLGKDFKGEGLVGLTRGFMYAGAQRVLVSLWDVDDKPTSEFMVRFYQQMLGKEKLSPAAALRMAQLELWKDPRWESPYFWAPFILQGDW